MTRSNLILAALVLLGFLLYGAEQRKRGRLEVREAEARRTIDSLTAVKQKVDTQYAGQKLVYAGWRERWDTARVAHLTAVIDSLQTLGVPKPETTLVPVLVSVLVTADSTIRSCGLALTSCESRVAVRDSLLHAWEQRWAARPKPPSEWRKWAERALVFGLGRLSK